MAKQTLEKELTYNKEEVSIPGQWKEESKQAKENFAFLEELDKKARERYPILGGYFTLPVADGKVCYQVVAVTERTATVKRCAGICLDEYADMILGYGATMSLQRASELVRGTRALNDLFSKRK